MIPKQLLDLPWLFRAPGFKDGQWQFLSKVWLLKNLDTLTFDLETFSWSDASHNQFLPACEPLIRAMIMADGVQNPETPHIPAVSDRGLSNNS